MPKLNYNNKSNYWFEYSNKISKLSDKICHKTITCQTIALTLCMRYEIMIFAILHDDISKLNVIFNNVPKIISQIFKSITCEI